MDLRKTITDHLERREMTPAELHRLLGGKIKKQTLYDYLNGKSDTGGIAVGHILDALGLVVVTRDQADGVRSMRAFVEEVFRPVIRQIPDVIDGRMRHIQTALLALYSERQLSTFGKPPEPPR